DGIMQPQPIGHRGTKPRYPAADQIGRIDEQRRAARFLDQRTYRAAADRQLAAYRLVTFGNRAHRLHDAISASAIRSILPLGLSAIVSIQRITAGCMKFGSSRFKTSRKASSSPLPRTIR